MSNPNLSPEAKYIVEQLFPELETRFENWSREYKQERDLGIRGEFVGLYRKVRKLKTALWDNYDSSNWRESVRTILLEVAGHALLAVFDHDKSLNNGKPDVPQAVVASSKDDLIKHFAELGQVAYASDTMEYYIHNGAGWVPAYASLPNLLTNEEENELSNE